MPTQGYPRHRAIVLALGAVYAAVAALTQPLTAAATLVWALPAALTLAVSLARRPSEEPPVRTRQLRVTTLAWAGVAALAVGLELNAWLRQPAYNVASADYPTVSVLFDPVLEPWPVRFVAWSGWLWVGWRLVRA